jgi:trk system potassium uptake protein TrkH
MRPHVVLRYVGFVLLFNALFMLVSSMLSAYYSDSGFFPLLYGGMISALFGVFPMIFVPPTTAITNKEGLFIVIMSWLLSCLAGLMPYVLWGGEFTLANAWFESVSGYTTTGSTILTDVEAVPRGLLFWRAATHWIGGSGIIIFVLSVLPSMGRAGMILYRTEMSPVAMDNFKYRTRKALQVLIVVYVGLTALETLSFLICGMDLFDAITHAFATIATGGFSTKNLSIAYYNSVSIEVVTMIFMVLSGVHFALLFSVISGESADLFRSTVVRYYLAALLIGTLITMVNIHGNVYESWGDALRYASFQVISLGTSTGFATADTSFWPPLAMLLLIFFTLQCACAGSTSGGIKVDRIVFFWKAMGKRITSIQHPRAVIAPRIDHVPISDDVLEMNLLYIVLYLAIVFVSSTLLSSLGVDSLTAFSGSAATMGNVGPGFGMVGSVSNFSSIPDAGKYILTADMLLGRLEIFGLVIFFMSKSWK